MDQIPCFYIAFSLISFSQKTIFFNFFFGLSYLGIWGGGLPQKHESVNNSPFSNFKTFSAILFPAIWTMKEKPKVIRVPIYLFSGKNARNPSSASLILFCLMLMRSWLKFPIADNTASKMSCFLGTRASIPYQLYATFSLLYVLWQLKLRREIKTLQETYLYPFY